MIFNRIMKHRLETASINLSDLFELKAEAHDILQLMTIIKYKGVYDCTGINLKWV